MTVVLAKLALAVVAVAPSHHTHLGAVDGSAPLTSHTDLNAARFKYHAGVSLHRAVLVIRRLQHLHREHRRAERLALLTSRVAMSPTRASGLSPSASAPTGGLPACTWRPESGGSYTAVNPSSGAYGKYQIIPKTWGAYCSDLSKSPSDQDTCAGRVYAGQGAGAWVNC